MQNATIPLFGGSETIRPGYAMAFSDRGVFQAGQVWTTRREAEVSARTFDAQFIIRVIPK